jgi:hypothetical protein
MSMPSPLRFAARAISALVALSMLIAPTMAQLTAAEICRVRCESVGAAAKSACCCKSTDADGQAELDAPQSPSPADQRGSDGGSKYCPGCGARPLIVASAPIGLTFDASPLYSPTTAPAVTHSVELSLAIFHPPRV